MVYLRREAPEATLVELLKDLCPKRQLMQVNTDGDPITTLDELFAHMEDLVPSPQADPLADVDDAMRKVFQEDDEPSAEFNLRLLTARYNALSKHGWTKQAMINEMTTTGAQARLRTMFLAQCTYELHVFLKSHVNETAKAPMKILLSKARTFDYISEGRPSRSTEAPVQVRAVSSRKRSPSPRRGRDSSDSPRRFLRSDQDRYHADSSTQLSDWDSSRACSPARGYDSDRSRAGSSERNKIRRRSWPSASYQHQ